MSKNKTTIATNNNLASSTNNNINSSTNKGQGVGQQTASSNLGKIGLDSIMGQKLVGHKISTVKR